ncbi:KRAB [Acanthosepion pharaonis]|uniref:KRAB n=1 Tax=Acanthosepion pharaonis TaxID=158019 RepID=A0A812CNI9_ACAPH|nr:KRAB [Sepia pharaonis]
MNVQLQMHLVTHSGERLFTCRICGRSYTVNSSLLAHLKTHTAEEVRRQAMQANPQAPISVPTQPTTTTTTPLASFPPSLSLSFSFPLFSFLPLSFSPPFKNIPSPFPFPPFFPPFPFPPLYFPSPSLLFPFDILFSKLCLIQDNINRAPSGNQTLCA